METIVKGIVISTQEYAESDAIVKILTPKRIFNVLALGVRKPESKNRYGLMIGTYGEFEIFASRLENKVSKLKKANAIISFDVLNKNNQAIFKELFFHLNRLDKINWNFFKDLETAWKLLGTNANYHLLTFIVNKSLKMHGLYPNFNACAECGSLYDISDFQYYKGGFLCQDHKTKKITTEQLYGYYYLDNNLEKYLSEISLKANCEIFQQLKSFLDENTF